MNQIESLVFSKKKCVTFLGLVFVATVAVACFSSVPVPAVPPLFPLYVISVLDLHPLL